MNADGLYDDQWLMAYEFDVQNWLPAGVAKYVAGEPNFRLLEAAGVRFYTPFSSTTSAAIVGPDLADYE